MVKSDTILYRVKQFKDKKTLKINRKLVILDFWRGTEAENLDKGDIFTLL